MSALPPSSPPKFYVDESIYSKKLVQQLIAAGVSLEAVGGTVPFGSPDEDWLAHCGKNGLIALTRDQRIRYRLLEKRALKEHGVGCVTFTGGNATAEQCATRIIEVMPKIVALADAEPRPFIYTVGLATPLAKINLDPT